MGNVTETSTFEEKIMEEYTKGINHFSEKYIKVKDKVSKLHLISLTHFQIGIHRFKAWSWIS